MSDEAYKRREQLQRIPALGCGLHRTTIALPGSEETVTAEELVLLHDHRPDEFPTVSLPTHCEANRWWFGEPGIAAEDADFLESLIPLPDEGYYALLRDLPLSDDPDDILLDGSLVMLGYDRTGNCILYPGRFEGLAIHFPDRGYRFDGVDVLSALERANFQEPMSDEDRAIH